MCVEAIPAISPLLDFDDPVTRAAAARTLGVLAAGDPKPRLCALAKEDPSLVVRRWSIFAVSVVADLSDRPFLEALLADRDWRIRNTALVALGRLRDPASLATVRRAQANDRGHLRYVGMRRNDERVIQRLEAVRRRQASTIRSAPVAEA
jgi:HEAT repeat protein